MADTPRPDCLDCLGEGGYPVDYADPHTGEYGGTDDVLCECWDPGRAWTLLPVPRWIAHRLHRPQPAPATAGSLEPPF